MFNELFSQINTMTIVILAASFGITILVLLFVARMVGSVTKGINQNIQQTNQVLMSGEPAEATVLTLAPAGVSVNYNLMMDVVLDVQPENRANYQARVRTLIPQYKMAQVQPGQKVRVMIDRLNAANIALNLL
jgi:high-affinity Fe2+/Pb2+ permease